MLLGKIVGTAVATIKRPELTGVKLLIVQPLNKSLNPVGPLKVAADAALRVGNGDTVVMVRSRDASMALETSGAPVDLAVVAIVDSVYIAEHTQTSELGTGYTSFTY